MELREIIQALELAPSEQKLVALGELNAHPNPDLLEQLRDPIEKIISNTTATTVVRFYATRALVVLGDRQDAVLSALESFLGEQVLSDRSDSMIQFPWVPELGRSTEGARLLYFRLRCNVSYAVVETFSRLRENERAASFVRKFFDNTEDTEIRILCIYAMGAIGHESTRPTLEYLKNTMSETPEGKASVTALQGFGKSSLFDFVGAPAAASKSSCFVVTALSGGPCTYEVQVCRDFRDSTLARYYTGRKLIDYYQVIGPDLAEWIKNHPRARTVVRLLILKPIIWLLTNSMPSTYKDNHGGSVHGTKGLW